MSAGKASIIAVIGASGTGKGQCAKARLDTPWRGLTLIWSPLEPTDRYADWIGARAINASIPALVAAIRAKARGVVFVPGPVKIAEQFDLFCRIAWECIGARVLIEELSRVTSPSWAPASWQNLSTAGRHRKLELIGTAQRPAQIDKDFLGNCTLIRCYRLNYENDAKAVSSVLRVPWESLMDLPDLHYLERHIAARENVAGVQPIVGARKKIRPAQG